MEQDFAQTLTRLPRDEMLRIRRARGRCVVVFHGMAWVTQEGDPRDRLLVGGESFTFDRSGVGLIHALEPTSLVVLERDAAAAMSVVEDLPVRVTLSARPQMTPQHVYRRARRLREVAIKRLMLRVVSYVRSAWAELSGARVAAARPVRRTAPTRVLHARMSQAG